MVAETLPDTTTETPTEVEEQTPIDSGDAAEVTLADAGSAPEPVTADIDAEVEAFVKEQTQKGSEQAQPEAARTEPQVDPEVLRMSEEARVRYQSNHKARHDAIDTEGDATIERLVADGYSRPVAEALVSPLVKAGHDKLNEHHADGIKDAGWQAAYEQNAQFWRGVEAGVPQEHHEAIASKLAEGKYGSYKDIAADLYEMGLKAGETAGYAKGEEAGLRTGYRNGLTRKANLASLSSDGQSVNGTGGGGGTFSSEDALHTAWNDKAISRDVYAREYKRLTGRDL